MDETDMRIKHIAPRTAMLTAIFMILSSLLMPAAARESGKGGSNGESGAIVVVVHGIESDGGGDLIVSLYSGKDGWLDIEKAERKRILPVEGDSAVVTFGDLPYDSVYAVAVVHDSNKNGKLDMRRFPWPKPKEGAGVSNNRFGFGPPDYDDARLSLSGSILRTRVGMRY
jgi:uncharacterized protein (DUF2141 family)